MKSDPSTLICRRLRKSARVTSCPLSLDKSKPFDPPANDSAATSSGVAAAKLNEAGVDLIGSDSMS